MSCSPRCVFLPPYLPLSLCLLVPSLPSLSLSVPLPFPPPESRACTILLQAVALIGEFNNWDPKDNHWATKNDFGVWGLFLPDNADGTSAVPHRLVILK